MPRETSTVLLILTLWLVLAVSIGLSGLFGNASAPAVAATVWGLTGFALLLCRIIPTLRSWTRTVDLRWLVALHLTRFVGVYFLMLGNVGALPQAFAKPAGIG